jgi:hypothetical protein
LSTIRLVRTPGVVLLSKHPNQAGIMHVELVEVPGVVVHPSRQPHHSGVLQVDVLVVADDVVVPSEILVVVVFVSFLLINCQMTQSSDDSGTTQPRTFS